MDKKPKKSKKLQKRNIFQAAWMLIINGNFKGFLEGKIYQGPLKKICVPGLNCYSCPGALGSCPIGSLQAVIGSFEFQASFYVIGFLMFFGSVLGRFVCGFLCPFGFIQDLLNKIPFPKKIKTFKADKPLRFLKYVILVVFVILLPLFAVDAIGSGLPWFCKWICPAGTLEGGIPLITKNANLQNAIGFLFTWKVAILAVTILVSIIIYRPFCKYICPLGAIYALFNKFSVYRYFVSEDACTSCGTCDKACPMQVKPVKQCNHGECIRCGVCKDVCPTGAISSGFVIGNKKNKKALSTKNK